MSVNELGRREHPTAGRRGTGGWLTPDRRLGPEVDRFPFLVSADGATRLERYGGD